MRLSQQESVAVRNIAAMPRAHLDTVYPGRKNGSEYCGLVAARLSRTERLNVQNRRWHPRGGDRGCARSSRASVPSLLRSTVQCSELLSSFSRRFSAHIPLLIVQTHTLKGVSAPLMEDVEMDAPQISTLPEEGSPEPQQSVRATKPPRVKLRLSEGKPPVASTSSSLSKQVGASEDEDDDEDEEDQLIDDDDDDVRPAPTITIPVTLPPPPPVTITATRGTGSRRGVGRGRGGGRKRGAKAAAAIGECIALSYATVLSSSMIKMPRRSPLLQSPQ